jgi:uncharacterized protein (TIGR03382 family)
LVALAVAVLLPAASGAYSFPIRQLTFDSTIKNSITMNGAVAGWISCVPDPVTDWDPLTCEVWVFDANAGGAAHAITANAVEEQCVAIDHRDVVFRRAAGAGQVVLRDLDAGETILSSAGIDADFYACPQISTTRVVWLSGGQVIVYDRALDTERVVGANASYPDLSGDYVVWQEGVDAASEVWFLDASSPANTPQRVTNNAISDERPTVAAISNFIPTLTSYPGVAWYSHVGSYYEIVSWNGTTTTPITDMSSRNHYFPNVTSHSTGLFFSETPAIAWTPNSPLEVLYCTTCDGDPSNIHGLPAADPFLAGAPYTSLEANDGGWIVFQRIRPAPASQFDIAFFEIDSGVVTPITDDAPLDDAASLGFRSVPPVGPAVVWRRVVGSTGQIFYAPEPGTAPLAALLALGALARRRRRVSAPG